MSAGFPTGIAVIAVLAQGLFGILPDTKPTPPPVAAPVAAISVPARPPAPIEAFAMLPDVVPIPKPRPKPARKPVHARKHKPAQMIRRAPPARPAPVPVRWSVSIRISL